MPVDHQTWEALGVTRGNNVRLLQTPSEEGAQSVTGDMSNPVSKNFVGVGISNSTSTQSGVLRLPTRGLKAG